MVFIAWTALEARQPAALARALGATPEQVSVGLSAVQLFPALVGALLGIPGGIGILDAAKSAGGRRCRRRSRSGDRPCDDVAVALLTAIPVRIGARRPVAEVLQDETA